MRSRDGPRRDRVLRRLVGDAGGFESGNVLQSGDREEGLVAEHARGPADPVAQTDEILLEFRNPVALVAASQGLAERWPGLAGSSPLLPLPSRA